jgi:hypothetical protein
MHLFSINKHAIFPYELALFPHEHSNIFHKYIYVLYECDTDFHTLNISEQLFHGRQCSQDSEEVVVQWLCQPAPSAFTTGNVGEGGRTCARGVEGRSVCL